MAITSYIPKLWETLLLSKMRSELVYGNLVNRDYEGMIKTMGDSVVINQIGEVTIKDYTGADISAAEDMSTTDQTLIIDKEKYYNFRVKDVDAAQAAGSLMEGAMESAGYAMATVIDKHIADLMAAGGSIKIGNDTTPIALTAANIYSEIVKIKVAMDKANVPKQGRWIVLPPDAEGLLLLDDRFVKAGVEASENRLVNGLVARAVGLDIYTSNNVPNTTNAKYKIIASYTGSTSHAEQIAKQEAYREEKNFSDAIKGLTVYGTKVVRPATIVVMTANFS